jgi:hypothetical protein
MGMELDIIALLSDRYLSLSDQLLYLFDFQLPPFYVKKCVGMR